MVTDTRAAGGAGRPGLSAGRLRPLNQPRPVAVGTAENGAPASADHRAVEAVIEHWRIEDEWWRMHAVRRSYWRLQLEDGRTIDVFRDDVRGEWYGQAYS